MDLAELRGHPYATKLVALTAATLLQALWLRFTATRIAPPAARFAAVAPLLAFNAAAPLIFRRDTEAVTLAFAAFMVTWLGSFKALALAAGRGPLVQQPWSLLQMWVLYVAPIVPLSASRPSGAHPGPGSPLLLLLRWLAKAAITAAVVFALLTEGLTPFARSCLYAVGIYAMLGVVMDGPAALVLRPLELSLAPHFVSPWEARSIADFWGCHWNQAAGNALRTTLYDSIMESALLAPGGHALLAPGRHARLAATCPSAGTGARRVSHPDGTLPDGATAAYKKTDGGPPGGTLAPSAAAAGASSASALQRRSGGALRRRRLLGMAACFVASGLVHELIFWYVTGGPTQHWKWLWFFSGQVPLIVAERRLLEVAQRKGAMPRLVLRRALTLGVLLAAGHFLFFQPAEAVAQLFAASIRQTFAALAALPTGLLAGGRR